MPTGRATGRSSGLLGLIVAAAVALAPARAQTPPDPQALLDATLAPPSVPYQGRVMVTQFFGRTKSGAIATRAEEMLVHVSPPDRVRREFLAPDGSVSRILISDGDQESVLLVQSGRTVLGNALRGEEKVLAPELERETLLSNYDLSVSTAEKVSGRATWRLTIAPKVEGKSWQTLWIDQDTKIVLRMKRWQPQRPFASEAQFTSFEPRKEQDPELFRVEDSTDGRVDASSGAVVRARGLAPRFLTLDQLGAAGGGPRLPDTLPGGFIFESADEFFIRKSPVRHARYTDGLTVLSVFQTDRPVRLPKDGSAIPAGAEPLPGALRASSAGKVLQWKVGARHYVMMADVSRDLMAEIAKTLP
jgi:outer membrane lipoprotein-sorting protein